MKMRNLLWMVICLLSLTLFTSCTSTDDGFDDGSDVLTEVEEAIDEELEDDEGFDDEEGDDFADSDDEGFGDEGEDDDFADEGFDDEGGDDFADSGDEGFGDDEGDDFGDDDFGDEGGDDFADAEDDGFGEEVAVNDDDFDDFAEEGAISESVNQDEAIEEAITEPIEEIEQVAIEEEPIIEEPIEQSVANNAVSSIDFDSVEGNTGVIVIKTASPAEISQRVNNDQRQMVIDIFNTTIPESLKRPFIMKDFNGTPFAGLNAYQQDNGTTTSVVIQMRPGTSMPQIQQEGNSILAMASSGAISPVASNEAPEESQTYIPKAPMNKGILSANNFYEFLIGNANYYGKPISIQANNVNIRDLLNFISEESGANIIVSKDVKGQISLKLRQVPWDQALVTIMKSNSLGYVREGNVLRIATLKELEGLATAIKKTHDNISQLQPALVKTYTINYADPGQIVGNIKLVLTPNKGRAIMDTRTNTMIITDSQEVQSKVAKIIKLLDIKPKQVLIEGKIVEAQEKFTQNIGVQWGAKNGSSIVDQSGGPFGSPILIQPRVEMNSSNFSQISAASGFASLTIGTLKSIGDLTASLALSENENLTKILSQPRILAMNKERAEISQKAEVLTITSTVDNGVVSEKVERKPVTLRLQVTPQITNNNDVLMDFNVSRAFPGAIENTQTLARAVNERAAKSKVIVKSGETAVIGGIYDSLGLKGETGPAGLRKIPIIGWLFKSKVKENTKNELLIFLTPKVMGDNNEV